MNEEEVVDLFDKGKNPIKSDKIKDTLFSNFSSLENKNTNEDGFFKLGNDNIIEANKRDEADAQSFGEQLGIFTGNTLSNIVTGTVGGIGYLGTLFSDKDKDYSNAITEWADSVRNPFGEIKRRSDEIFDLTDTGFWLNHGQSLVESAVQFGIIAETGGLAAGALGAKLGNVLKLTNTGMKILKAGVQGLTSAELSYLEGAMSGSMVYKDIYDKQYKKLINQGLSIEEADNKAKEFASYGATSTVKLNTTIGTALNLTGIGSVFRNNKNIPLDYFTKGAGKRLASETINEYKDRLIKQSPDFLKGISKTEYAKLISEMGQEGIEEVVTQLAENTGKDIGMSTDNVSYLDSFEKAYNNINSVLNDEGILNFALGSIGGLGQTVLIDNVIPSQKINQLNNEGNLIYDKSDKNGNPVYKTKLVSPKRRDIYDNQIIFNNLKDSLFSDLDYIENISNKILTTNDKVEREEMYRKLFAVNTYDSIYKGLGDNLVNSYEKILNVDNSRFLSENYSKNLSEINDLIETKKEELSQIENEEEKTQKETELKQLLEEQKRLSDLVLKTNDKTEATELGLAKDKNDNDYKIRATKAINTIKQLSQIQKENKEKYILPEEVNSNYSEFLTKLQGDILGRKQIIQDLENDFNNEKLKLSSFMSLEDFEELEKIISNSELKSIDSEMKNIKDKLDRYNKDDKKNISELEDIIDNLSSKVYNDEDVLKEIDKKYKKLQEVFEEKSKDFYLQIKESERFKKSGSKNVDDYLNNYITKNDKYANLLEFKKSLDTYKRNITNLENKYAEVSSNKGRIKFINDFNYRVNLAKESLKNDYAIYSYNEAIKLADEVYYNKKINKLNEEEILLAEKKIVNIQDEIQKLEETFNQLKDKSAFSSNFSFLNDFLTKMRDINILVKIKKAELNNIKDYLDKSKVIKEEGQKAIEKVTEEDVNTKIKKDKPKVKQKEEVLKEVKIELKKESEDLSIKNQPLEKKGEEIKKSVFSDLQVDIPFDDFEDFKGLFQDQTIDKEDDVLYFSVSDFKGLSDKEILLRLSDKVDTLEGRFDSIDDILKSILSAIKEEKEVITIKKVNTFVDKSSGEILSDRKEDILPFTLNMFRTQYGNISVDFKMVEDAKINYELPLKSEFEIRLTKKGDDRNEDELSFFSKGLNKVIGFLPTSNFIETTYNKIRGDENTKNYYPDDSGIYKLEHEINSVEFEMSNFLFTKEEKDRSIRYYESGLININYTELNRIKINKLRNLFKKNPNLVINTTLINKSDGNIPKALKYDTLNSVFDFNNLKDSRVNLHIKSGKVLTPEVSTSSDIENLEGIYFLSYPNANGLKNLIPLTVNKINDKQSEIIYEILNTYYNNIDSFLSIANSLSIEGITKQEKLKNMLQRYFFNFSDYNSNKSGIKITYFQNEDELVFSNDLDFKFSINSNTIGKYKDFIKTNLSKLYFTIDKDLLNTFDYNVPFKSLELKNKKLVIKNNTNYYSYVSDNLTTNARINKDNKDSKGLQIYVTDFVLNFDSSFYKDIENVSDYILEPEVLTETKEDVIIEEPFILIENTKNNTEIKQIEKSEQIENIVLTNLIDANLYLEYIKENEISKYNLFIQNYQEDSDNFIKNMNRILNMSDKDIVIEINKKCKNK